MRSFLYGILAALLFAAGYYLSHPATPTTPTDPRIATLTAERDCLDWLLSMRIDADTVYLIRYKTLTVKEDSAKAAIEVMPPTEAVQFFSEKTGADSLVMLSDTTAAVSVLAIKVADKLFIEGEAAKQKVEAMQTHLASKDTTIALQTKRIVSGDSLAAVTDTKYRADLSAAKAAIKKEKILKNIFTGATALEAALILLSMFI